MAVYIYILCCSKTGKGKNQEDSTINLLTDFSMFPTNMLYCELPGTATRSVQFFRNVTEPGNFLLLVPATECYNFLAVLGLTINPTETLLLVWCDSSVII